MPLLLGIDCGGSSTRALVVDDGRPIWSGSGGPANVAAYSREQYSASLFTATEGCPLPSAVCGAFAGLLSSDQVTEAENALKRLFPDVPIAVVPDFEAALVACGSEQDVCVLAGTGSLVCSFGPNGELFKSGGKGYLLGDEGSAFQYGREALLHFLDAPPDDVTQELKTEVGRIFGTTNRAEVMTFLYAAQDIPRLLAELSTILAQEAASGETYALRALRIHPGKLAHVVSRHLQQYHSEKRTIRIGCQGGVWVSQVYRDAFVEQASFWLKVDEVELDFDPPAPVYGAAEIAGRLR